MDAIKTFLEMLFNSPHYAHGWLVLAALAILPAIVSGNLIQHDISMLLTGKNIKQNFYKTLLLNIAILLICIAIIANAFYLYVWL